MIDSAPAGLQPSESVHPPVDAVRSAVATALAEDLGSRGDLTASLVPSATVAVASFVARQTGIVAGTACATETFRRIEPVLEVTWMLDDGDPVAPGQTIGQVRGPLRAILTGERTALNFLCHLSGVASATRQVVEIVKSANPACEVRDTRKTMPGLRVLEKAAVRAGGGINHRSDLSEGILVKDNHLTGITIADAVAEALKRWPGVPVEVECDTEDQVSQTVRTGAPLVLLDNMVPAQVASCARIAHEAGVRVEVSGGIGPENAGAYAAAGADYVSVGRITHSALILDIGLDIEPESPTRRS